MQLTRLQPATRDGGPCYVLCRLHLVLQAREDGSSELDMCAVYATQKQQSTE